MSESMLLSTRLKWLLGITALTVLQDQGTKVYAVAQLDGQPPPLYSFLGDTLRIQLARNVGAFLGMFGNLPENVRWAILVAGNSALMIGLVLFLLIGKQINRWSFFTFALVFAGGVGNLIDRVLYNYVIDFLNLGIGPVRTGIFNIADMAITAGFFMLVWQMFRGEESPEPSGVSTADASSATSPAA